MADTFYIKQGATAPALINTFFDEADSPVLIDGTVVLRIKHRYHGTHDFPATLLDQNQLATRGQVKVSRVAINPVTNEPLPRGKYKAEWRNTTTTGELLIMPTAAAPFYKPEVDEIVIQRAL